MADLTNSTATLQAGPDGEFTGITVKVEAGGVDLYRFGEWLSRQPSGDQAEFLLGLADGIDLLNRRGGRRGDLQLEYIHQDVGSSPTVDHFIATLNAARNGE